MLRLHPLPSGRSASFGVVSRQALFIIWLSFCTLHSAFIIPHRPSPSAFAGALHPSFTVRHSAFVPSLFGRHPVFTLLPAPSASTRRSSHSPFAYTLGLHRRSSPSHSSASFIAGRSSSFGVRSSAPLVTGRRSSHSPFAYTPRPSQALFTFTLLHPSSPAGALRIQPAFFLSPCTLCHSVFAFTISSSQVPFALHSSPWAAFALRPSPFAGKCGYLTFLVPLRVFSSALLAPLLST